MRSAPPRPSHPRGRITLPALWRQSRVLHEIPVPPPHPHELPFRLLVIGDLTGEDRRCIEDRKPLHLVRDRLDEVRTVRRLSGAEPPSWGALQQLRGADPPIWDALRRLVLEVGGMPGIQVEALNATRAELLGECEDSPYIDANGLFKHLYGRTYYGAGCPYGALLFAPTFEPDDLKLVEQLAVVAAVSHTPFIANPSPELAASDAWRALRASPDGAYLGTGDLVETAVKLVRDFVAIGHAEEAGGIDPRLLVASRVAQCLKVLRRELMHPWRTREAVEQGINAWLAELASPEDDGWRPFRIARVRVWAADAPWWDGFDLEIETHAGPGAALGPIRIQGRMDMA